MNRMQSFNLTLRGKIVEVDHPLVMGILNSTPDSFYAQSRHTAHSDIAARVESMIAEGVDIIDLGAYSSRPGADNVEPAEELSRIKTAMAAIRSVDTSIPVSIDTFRANVAREAIESLDADIINDISGGDLDNEMFDTAAALRVPYILMHMRGNPATMQSLTNYDDHGGVTAAVCSELSKKIDRLQLLGVNDIIVDPGFGFSKTLEQNWRLMRKLPEIGRILGKPILVGISRKSMLTRPLGISANTALEATTVANTLALCGGASILRVHDVAAARQAITLYQLFENS